MKYSCCFSLRWLIFILIFSTQSIPSKCQLLKLPAGITNLKCLAGRKVGVTDVLIKWNAPGVKGREGKIWGTNVAPYGVNVLGFGSNVASPWRAGADESTSITFSTDVFINGNKLKSGEYGFFIELYPDSCILIFNKNSNGWGSYFYRKDFDELRVVVLQQKNIKPGKERLEFTFNNMTEKSVEIALEWEHWKIPFILEVDLLNTALESIQTQMSGAVGFDPPSLQAAASWCAENNVNLEEALGWINSATDPNLGGVNSFRALMIKAQILSKLNKHDEADKLMSKAIEQATSMELHGYGRQLIAEQKFEKAYNIFEANYKKSNGAWPTSVGMMRGYSALGNLSKALEYAKIAIKQAPDEINRANLDSAIKTLESGKKL